MICHWTYSRSPQSVTGFISRIGTEVHTAATAAAAAAAQAAAAAADVASVAAAIRETALVQD